MASYVPAVPGVPAPMSYGQGYGDWQQYAGFSKVKNPYGGGQGFGVQPEDKRTGIGVAPPIEADTNVPAVPEMQTPDYGMPQQQPSVLGNNPEGQLGLKPTSTLGGISNTDVIKSHFGGF